jgi:hypothetical protein
VKAAEEADYHAESSATLASWSGDGLVLFNNPIDHGDGTETRSYRSTKSIREEPTRFFRLRLIFPEQRPCLWARLRTRMVR